MIKLIVGLGNPGLRYAHTRHNIGFDVLDEFASRHKSRIRRKYCRALVADISVSGQRIILAKPQTFMNSSGESVREILMRCKLSPSELLVVCDDVNLPLGKLRLRPKGSAGGQHGLESIINCIRSNEFARLRIGIGEGHNPRDVVDHVLSRFHKAEVKLVDEVKQNACDCIDTVITETIELAMNRFN